LLSERRIMQVFQELAVTRIVVAHRPTAIEGADRVFAVERGAVVERSAHSPERAVAVVADGCS
jgi:ATP-binding cassette subfamily B protein RaxB